MLWQHLLCINLLKMQLYPSRQLFLRIFYFSQTFILDRRDRHESRRRVISSNRVLTFIFIRVWDVSCNRKPGGADEQLTVKINHPVAKGRGRTLDCVSRDTLKVALPCQSQHVANGVEIAVALKQKYHLFPFLGKSFLYQNSHVFPPNTNQKKLLYG